jgi:glycosyltransferase involved in cell wall biosynthesis/GT2 family glycosyltransferase
MTFRHLRMRATQLTDRSRLIIQNEGWGAFISQLYRWLFLGERTYYKPSKFKLLEKRYAQWIVDHLPTPAELDRQRAHTFDYQPRFSIVIPVYNPPPGVFTDMLQSILAQTYPHFEVCLANAGKRPAVQAAVEALNDDRLRLHHLEKNAGIAANTNAAIGMAQGDFIVFMDHDDRIVEQALYRAAEALNADPTLDILYSDHHKIDDAGKPFHGLLKPGWSPEMLHNGMYTGHLSIYRRTLVEKVDRLRPAFDGSQDYDLILRASEHTDRIHHLPYVLYEWRAVEGSAAGGGKFYARKTNIAALEEALQRRGLQGHAEALPVANRCHLTLNGTPTVSIIIPTDDEQNALRTIEGLYQNTAYPAFEVIVVTNSALAATLDALPHQTLHTVPFDEPFNFSLKCNRGAEAATGDYLLFLNDDVTPLNDEWLHAMMQYAQLPEIGGVSGKLLYTDDTIQYAGMVTNVRDFVGTSFHTWEADDLRHYSIVNWVRNVSVLSGACLLTRAEVFNEVGGWDAQNAPIANSDLDLSFKLRAAGYRLVYTPYAKLRHIGHESIGKVDRGERRFDDSHLYMLAHWGGYLSRDPYFPATTMRDLLYPLAEGFAVYASRSADNLHALQSGQKRILLITHDLSLSGAPIILLELARRLKAEGVFLTVISAEDGPLRHDYRALDIPVIIDPAVLTSPEAVQPLYYPFDLIIPNTAFCWPVVQTAHRAGKKTLWLVHEPHFGVKAINLWGRDAKQAFALADAVTYPAKSARQMYSQWAGDNRHEVIYYGITDPHPIEATSPLPLPRTHPGRLHLVCVGTIEERKGIDSLIEMLTSLPPEVHQRIEVTFVGRFLFPDFAERMQAAVAHLPNITFTGQVPHQAALQYTSQCDVYLCASRDETGPIVVIEALAFGKPVITTNVGAVGELIESGTNGFVVEDIDTFRQHLITLLNDDDLRQQMGQAARDLYERQFHISRYAYDLSMLISDLIDEPVKAIT